LDGILVPHSTVSAAAEFYLEAVDEICPKGPLHLLGHSFGGWVAFDLAQRLQAVGRHIENIVILDSQAPDDQGSPVREYTRTEVVLRMVDIFEEMLGHSIQVGKLNLDPLSGMEQLTYLHGCLVKAGLMPSQSHPDVMIGPFRTFGTALRTVYRPDSKYLGPIHLVLADDQRIERETLHLKHEQIVDGWRNWAPDLCPMYVPGNHMTMLKPPSIYELAKQLRFGV